ncbi:hypothetical protein MRBLMR1_005785 [Neorhizobium sp. LMR1-1-1.1]
MTQETIPYVHLIERQIVTLLADTILQAGYLIEIDNGGGEDEIALAPTAERSAVMEALFASGYDTLNIYDNEGNYQGFFYLVYNLGAYVISNYTGNELFDRLARPAEALSRKIEGWVDDAGYFDREMNTEVNADLTYDTALPRAA